MPPLANRYWRFVNVRGRPVVLLSKDARIYKKRIASLAPTVRRIDGPVRLTLRIFRPRRAGDVDSTIKPMLDALQGVLYENDRQIVELHAYRGDDKTNPRVEVEAVAC